MEFWKLFGQDWFKRDYPNMIAYYKRYLYGEWFQELSPEQQQTILRKEQEEKDQRWKKLALFFALFFGLTCADGSLWDPFTRD